MDCVCGTCKLDSLALSEPKHLSLKNDGPRRGRSSWTGKPSRCGKRGNATGSTTGTGETCKTARGHRTTPGQWIATAESLWSAEKDHGDQPLRHDRDVENQRSSQRAATVGAMCLFHHQHRIETCTTCTTETSTTLSKKNTTGKLMTSRASMPLSLSTTSTAMRRM